MIVTIHQPEHLPWTGFFHKMALADHYVLLDNVQFKTSNWQNRNRIVTRDGQECFVTIPVITKGHTSTVIRDIRINNTEKWQKKYWGRIQNAYCKHLYWNEYSDELARIIHAQYVFLIDLNLAAIDFFRKALSLNTPLTMASDLHATGKSTELLVNICKECGASEYISGPDGKNYMNMQLWNDAAINVSFHTFSPPRYEARHYIQGLSTLDILMNLGPQAARTIGI